MARVLLLANFRTDVRAQLDHLLRTGELARIAILRSDLAESRELLSRFPLAGREIVRGDREVIRTLRLRRSPFRLWYATGDGAEVVRLIRLFHLRQHAPDPRPA